MKKFIYIFILLVGFQFAQAQEVNLLGYVTGINEGQISYYDLNGLSFNPVETSLPLPLMVVFENTGSTTIAYGDSIVLSFSLNGTIVLQDTAVVVSADAAPGEEAFIITGVVVSKPLLLSGNANNNFCAEITGVFISGVYSSVSSTPYCAQFTVASTTSIISIDNLKDVSIYPNPVSDQLKINNLTEATDIHIYSVTGQLVKTVSAATGSVDINVTNLSNGIYIVKMQSGKNTRTEKIQVIR